MCTEVYTLLRKFEHFNSSLLPTISLLPNGIQKDIWIALARGGVCPSHIYDAWMYRPLDKETLLPLEWMISFIPYELVTRIYDEGFICVIDDPCMLAAFGTTRLDTRIVRFMAKRCPREDLLSYLTPFAVTPIAQFHVSILLPYLGTVYRMWQFEIFHRMPGLIYDVMDSGISFQLMDASHMVHRLVAYDRYSRDRKASIHTMLDNLLLPVITEIVFSFMINIPII